ncbi:MAG: small subunit ribosomal protein S2 [Colwellia polaris]|jgi:small subunit ribosomal protein S2
MSEEELLIDRDEYLANGVHIGTRSQTKDMEPYIFHVKKNQLAVLDVQQTDEKIRELAEYLADIPVEEILVVGRKDEAHYPIDRFTEVTGASKIIGRFMPGTLTNPESVEFQEPEVLVACDPEEDSQAIKEAHESNIPVIGIADSESSLENVDYVIPANNKGENSLSTVFYLLSQQMAEQKGEEFDYELDFFKENPEPEEEEE